MIKWFQHQSNAHGDLDIEPLIDEFGLESYGFWWITCELVAEKGINYRVKARKNWKNNLKNTSKFSSEKLEKILARMVALDLINEKAYSKGDLYIPKMRRYSDDYTKRIRRVFKHTSDSVRKDKIREDKIKEDKSIIKDFKKNPSKRDGELKHIGKIIE